MHFPQKTPVSGGVLTLLGKILHTQRQFPVSFFEIINHGRGKSFNLT